MLDTDAEERLNFDLKAREQVFGDGDEIEIAAGSEEFWEWYASMVRFGRTYRLVSKNQIPPYPPAAKEVCLWYSGGAESTYTSEHISHLNPTRLRIDDFSLFRSRHRNIGQIHFLCAAVSASLGFRTTYMGIERSDLLLANNPFARQYVERTELFANAWSKYQPEHQLVTICGHLDKEEILEWLCERDIKITGTCDRYIGGEWCGDCYKCFEAFFTAKALGIDLGIGLSRRGFDEYYAQYRRYVESDFTDNFNNAYQHYVRLQIKHGLRFEPETDCVK